MIIVMITLHVYIYIQNIYIYIHPYSNDNDDEHDERDTIETNDSEDHFDNECPFLEQFYTCTSTTWVARVQVMSRCRSHAPPLNVPIGFAHAPP